MISDSRLQSFVDELAMSADVVEASVADNCRFDERAAEGRWQAFCDQLPDESERLLDYTDLAKAASDYKQRWLDVPSKSVPIVFLTDNQQAWLQGMAPQQTLVRMEVLSRPLASQNLGMEDLQRLQADKAVPALKHFLDGWNRARDNRPSFATFLDEVQVEVESGDWQHQLRDRLGLGFYPHGARCPVALMRYSLAEVLQAARHDKRVSSACALPTVLDGGMHEYFYPVPDGRPYGATLHLAEGRADLLTAEILHVRIDYRPEHLWKLGWIERPHRLSEAQSRDALLRAARDLHLLQLQIDSEREDFGVAMEGRT